MQQVGQWGLVCPTVSLPNSQVGQKPRLLGASLASGSLSGCQLEVTFGTC